MNLSTITKDNECIYLTQDLSGMGVYDKAKAIVSFCDKETKLFEKEIDRVILEIFDRNGIEIPNTEKSVLKLAFDLLKANGKDIEIVDIYQDMPVDSIIKKTKNHFSIYYDKEYIECGVSVKEIKL